MKRLKIGILSYESGELFKTLRENIEVWHKNHSAVRILISNQFRIRANSSLEKVEKKQLALCDYLIAVGGDGTFLSAARIVAGKSIPLIGINTGRVGFLTDFAFSELNEALNSIIENRCKIRSRMMLEIVVKRKRKILFKETLLNELHIKPESGRTMLDLAVSLQDKSLTDYSADGLIISTPTGSTAYNLSAGGPILHPATQAIVLNPLNPASLSVRPLVIPSELKIMAFERQHYGLELILDGRIHRKMKADDQLFVSKSPLTTLVVRSPDHGFVDALQNKLGWTGAPGPSIREGL